MQRKKALRSLSVHIRFESATAKAGWRGDLRLPNSHQYTLALRRRKAVQPHDLCLWGWTTLAASEPASVPGVQAEAQGEDEHGTHHNRAQAEQLLQY